MNNQIRKEKNTRIKVTCCVPSHRMHYNLFCNMEIANVYEFLQSLTKFVTDLHRKAIKRTLTFIVCRFFSLSFIYLKKKSILSRWISVDYLTLVGPHICTILPMRIFYENN